MPVVEKTDSLRALIGQLYLREDNDAWALDVPAAPYIIVDDWNSGLAEIYASKTPVLRVISAVIANTTGITAQKINTNAKLPTTAHVVRLKRELQ